MGRAGLEERVQRASEDALAAQQYVSAVDVLVRLGWSRSSCRSLNRRSSGAVPWICSPPGQR
jgi:hypothetical protein